MTSLGAFERVADCRESAAAVRVALQPVLDSFHDSVLLVDGRGAIAGVNRAAETLFGTLSARLIGLNCFGLMADRQSQGFLDYLRGTLLPAAGSPAPAGTPVELVGRRVDGALFPIEVTSGRVEQAGGLAYTLVIRDISERKAQEKALRDGANRDRLTHVATRAHIEQLAETELFRASRYGRALSILLFDIDRFKAVNATYGHAAGDAVLHEVARRCRTLIRASDLIGRWGGEEFLVMTPETALEGGRSLGERLRKVVADRPCPLDTGDSLSITVSVGIAQYAPGDAGFAAIVARADAALYRAKEAGRNRVEIAAVDDVEAIVEHSMA